jgi:hypothetical protein
LKAGSQQRHAREEFEEEQTEALADWSDTSKRRRREPKSSEAMREAFVQNREKLVEASDKMSEKED